MPICTRHKGKRRGRGGEGQVEIVINIGVGRVITWQICPYT